MNSRIQLRALGLALATGFGCATMPPTDHLADARRHYVEARTGLASRYEPDLLHDAAVALDEAETMHARRPGSEAERHLAYIADRKAMLATAAARERVAQANLADADDARARIRQQRVYARER